MFQVSSFRFQVPDAFAANYQMLFCYPGEAGTTEEAQTTLDAFFDYVNTKIAPDKIGGKYFNSFEGGAAFIKQSKPKFGIISFAAYQMNSASLGQNAVLMQTLPLPDGKPAERYVIVGKGAAPKDWTNTTLYSKQPLTAAFVEKYILTGVILSPQPKDWRTGKGAKNPVNTVERTGSFANAQDDTKKRTGSFANAQDDKKKLTTVNNILPTLKDVAAGTKTGGVILQPIEYFTLKNLQQPWVKELSVWHTSQDIPSAPLVIFGYVAQDLSPANIGRPEGLRYKFGADDPFVQRFKATLLNMSNDPQGKAILEMLRLKGFVAQ